jgi:hypothetical protein
MPRDSRFDQPVMILLRPPFGPLLQITAGGKNRACDGTGDDSDAGQGLWRGGQPREHPDRGAFSMRVSSTSLPPSSTLPLATQASAATATDSTVTNWSAADPAMCMTTSSQRTRTTTTTTGCLAKSLQAQAVRSNPYHPAPGYQCVQDATGVHCSLAHETFVTCLASPTASSCGHTVQEEQAAWRMTTTASRSAMPEEQ